MPAYSEYPRTAPGSAVEALARLRDGNTRFVRDVRTHDATANQVRRDALVAGQWPFAIVLSCSDSRVPSEMVFDCGLGDLFVVRVAGNIVAPSIVGSVEFAADAFGTELVVVMGHTQCGAITATLDAIEHRGGIAATENIGDIVKRIAPAVSELVHLGIERAALLRAATRANVRASVSHMRHGSALLEKRCAEGRLRVIGAEYALETGVVDFFDGVTEGG